MSSEEDSAHDMGSISEFQGRYPSSGKSKYVKMAYGFVLLLLVGTVLWFSNSIYEEVQHSNESQDLIDQKI